MLTIAVSKGRIYEEALPLLKEAGITPLDDPEKSRKLILQTTRDDVQLVIIRATDVPTFVEYGAADLGIAGKDVLLEHGAESLYEPLDLKIACCKLMTATHKDAPEITGRVRVATKYVKTAQRYFASLGIQAEIIKLYGSMELAPLVGLADCIVDLVDTGNTLKANGLEPRDLIMNISSRLVVNKAAMKMKHQAIAALLEQFEHTLAQR
ncbi:MAG: ATP phosphoribosyltransferase [Methylococcaceae bacterium]|jgi:ATP phosphoribosyltransferase|nr:ATP phosphoribosyltransferase [Methylococcaceae bacterium]MDZ4155991.1 ATP phosphoribosyltransferase [Methylococcales bacterium]PPD51110.1 MAG: ATP phosphoribosyltransferase [Methylobacter sp.]MDP2395190.1 ATP phosphoribosyltransferase [Methylococcaceae bacterium]MDP3018668.1 ATP phosphoribosyltransferase [Methylococcaceae bacterium]